MSLSEAVGQIGSINHDAGGVENPQWAAVAMGTCRALLSTSSPGESPGLAWRRAEDRNFLTRITGQHNLTCRTGKKNWDRKLFCSFKPCRGMASSA